MNYEGPAYAYFSEQVTSIEINTALTPIPAPVADYTAATTGGPSPVVSFTSTSTGNITSYSWDLGDGTTSTEQNPAHTYTFVGHCTVTLTVTGPGGSDSRMYVVPIGKPCAFRGRLADSVTGNGITGATVTFACDPAAIPYGATDHAAVTDANGYYFVEDMLGKYAPSSGAHWVNYEVLVSVAGYDEYDYQWVNFYSSEDVTHNIALTSIGDLIVRPGESIQGAIDASQSGDSIYVYSGIYEENITIQSKSINLVGENTSDTVIKGNILAENSACVSIENIFVQYKAGEPLIGEETK